MKLFRSIALLTLATAALSAHAVVAFSNLDAAPNVYSTSSAYTIGDFAGLFNVTQGFQFTSGATGTLGGFQLAMNGASIFADYTLQLYTDNGSNAYGSLLGTFNGNGTDQYWGTTTSALSTISTAGSSINLTSGAKYWIVASSPRFLSWNFANSGFTNRHLILNGDVSDDYSNAPAFAVYLGNTPPPTSTPAPLAALPFALGLLKRRKRQS